MLLISKTPVQTTKILEEIRNSCKLNISRNFLYNYLRKELNVSYRLIKPICEYHNWSYIGFAQENDWA